ncbi:MAG: hypothetical protein U0401_23600 [Anaerolineae bacterium]
MTFKGSREVKQVIQSVAGILIGHFSRPALPGAFDYRVASNLSTLPTGFRSLDKAMGLAGLPCGHITELSGTLGSTGTLTLAAGIAAKVQRKQQVVTILDLSQQFDLWQAERCALIAPHLLLTRPKTIFEALITLEQVSQREGLVLVSLGVVADLLSQVERDLLHHLLGRLRTIVKRSTSAILFVTVALDDNPFSPANYPAGFPLSEVADIRLWLQNEAWTQRDGVATAYKASLVVVKNRLALAGKGADIKITLL